MAKAMFEQGADIVYQIAGGTGMGVIQAAKESGHCAIGVDTDQDGIAPGSVLTSMIKRIDVAVETVIKEYAAGRLCRRQDDIVDAPINKARFELYAETQLTPELKPGDIVILDNVAFHKSELAVGQRGAWLLPMPAHSPASTLVWMLLRVKGSI